MFSGYSTGSKEAQSLNIKFQCSERTKPKLLSICIKSKSRGPGSACPRRERKDPFSRSVTTAAFLVAKQQDTLPAGQAPTVCTLRSRSLTLSWKPPVMVLFELYYQFAFWKPLPASSLGNRGLYCTLWYIKYSSALM